MYQRPADDGEGGGADSAGESGGNVVGTGNDARIALLESINDLNDAQNAAELADVNDDGTTTPFKVATDEANSDDPEAEAARLAAETETARLTAEEAAVDAQNSSAPKKFKIKVNGKELELTQDELITRAQKVESADEYLAEAAAARRATEPKKEVPTGSTPAELAAQQLKDEEDRAIVRAIQVGSEEEALLAVRKLSARQASLSLTQDGMSRAIDERLAFNEAMTKFRTDFSDITGDPLLNQLAMTRDSELLQAGDNRAYTERYTQIGGELRAWKESLAPTPVVKPASAEPNSDMSNREAKKAAAPKPLPAATKKVTPVQAEEDDGEEDASSVISAIAKARGGPQWMKA